jgi:hypothetical protein
MDKIYEQVIYSSASSILFDNAAWRFYICTFGMGGVNDTRGGYIILSGKKRLGK